MTMRFRVVFIAIFVTICGLVPVRAQQKEANVRSGQEIGLFYVCKYEGGSASLEGTAANGTMRTASERSDRCGAKGEITRIFYRSVPGFKGQDTAYIYCWGQRWDVVINVR